MNKKHSDYVPRYFVKAETKTESESQMKLKRNPRKGASRRTLVRSSVLTNSRNGTKVAHTNNSLNDNSKTSNVQLTLKVRTKKRQCDRHKLLNINISNNTATDISEQ